MDFDFNTILYIILGVIYFIFTGVSKNKKKGQQKRSRPQQQGAETLGSPPVSRRPSFEELLEEFTTGEALSTESKDLDLVPIILEEKKPLVTNAKPLPVFENHKIMPQDLGHSEEFDDEEVESSPYAQMFKDMDSTKKAFVASEVFRKKYT